MSANSTPFRDRKADLEYAESLGTHSIRRAIVDGQRGYLIIGENGVGCFHYRLGTLIRDLLARLDHDKDRDVMVVGEPEEGNCW